MQMMVQYPQYAGLAFILPYIVVGIAVLLVLVVTLFFGGRSA